MAWGSSSLHLWFKIVIQVDGDVLCLMLVEEEFASKQPRHPENINEMQAE